MTDWNIRHKILNCSYPYTIITTIALVGPGVWWLSCSERKAEAILSLTVYLKKWYNCRQGLGRRGYYWACRLIWACLPEAVSVQQISVSPCFIAFYPINKYKHHFSRVKSFLCSFYTSASSPGSLLFLYNCATIQARTSIPLTEALSDCLLFVPFLCIVTLVN